MAEKKAYVGDYQEDVEGEEGFVEATAELGERENTKGEEDCKRGSARVL